MHRWRTEGEPRHQWIVNEHFLAKTRSKIDAVRHAEGLCQSEQSVGLYARPQPYRCQIEVDQRFEFLIFMNLEMTGSYDHCQFGGHSPTRQMLPRVGWPTVTPYDLGIARWHFVALNCPVQIN